MKEGLYCNMVYLHILLSWLLSVFLHTYVDISKYYCTSYNTIKLSSISNKSWSKIICTDDSKSVSYNNSWELQAKQPRIFWAFSEYTSPFQLHDYRLGACSLSWCNVRSFPRFVAQRYNHFSSTRKWANIIKKAIQYCTMCFLFF